MYYNVLHDTLHCNTGRLKIQFHDCTTPRTADDSLSTVRVGLDIYRREGVRGLWRGVGPTAQRSLLAMEIMMYTIMQTVMNT